MRYKDTIIRKDNRIYVFTKFEDGRCRVSIHTRKFCDTTLYVFDTTRDKGNNLYKKRIAEGYKRQDAVEW